MRTSVLVLVIICVIVAFSCSDTRDQSNQKLPRQYDRTVGQQIPLTVAKRWVTNFSGSMPSGREGSKFSISKSKLQGLLKNIDGTVGIALHHAADEGGEHHILVSTIEEDGELFKADIVDLATGESLAKTTAVSWTARYEEAHPATPWYHFFGVDVFHEILSNSAFTHMDVIRGLNDDAEEQVLLFVYNSEGVSGGRGEGENVTVYDISSPCPPCSTN